MSRKVVAAIETGGTKILARICAVESGAVIAEQRWSTGAAGQAVDALTSFLTDLPNDTHLASAGIAAFGPLIVNRQSPDYGRMLATPKPGWAGSNLRAELQQRLGVPVEVDTDVNLAAIAEQRIGAGKGVQSSAYVTVGTGIGGGLATNGHSLKGAMHPEIGHLGLSRLPGDDAPSSCPFHADCAEGLLSGPAIRSRLEEGQGLADAPAVIELAADYLGQLAAALVLAWSPHRIVWGGGVINAAPLVPMIGRRLQKTLGGYGVGACAGDPDFCVVAALENAGLEGALMIAREAAI